MNKTQPLIALLLATLLLAALAACSPRFSKREAKLICLNCGWTGIEIVPRSAGVSSDWEFYCTRVRDGRSEVKLIELVMAECPAIIQKTLEALPDEGATQ